jgi:arylsulfatase A-like enzyme
MYRIGLQTADRMFGELVNLLRTQGRMRNAVVIVLSDHGEALNLPSDTFFDETFHVDGLRAPLKMLPNGHGQSVLSQSQYKVLVSFRSFGDDATFGRAGRDLDFPMTVEDIAPTILEYLAVPGDPLSVTGQSVLSDIAVRRNAG